MIKKIFSPLCLFFSIFLFVYVFYRSQIHWDGEQNDYYLVYFIISLLLIIFSIISFYFNEKIKQYLMIILISILATLYVFELYLIYKVSSMNEQKIQKTKNIKQKLLMEETGKKFDMRSRYKIFSDLKKKSPNIQVSFHTSDLLTKKNSIFPFAGISNSKTIFCNENGYYAIYESDRYGFNNPDEEWDQKNFEFLLVGDSHAHGACVNRPNDIGSVLRILTNKSILNLGYSGWGPLIQYAILREYLIPDVKNILWIYFEGNDLSDLRNELESDLLREYFENLDFSQNLRNRQEEIDNFAKEIIIEQEKYGNKINFDIIKFLKVSSIRKHITSFFVGIQEKKRALPILEFKKILLLAQKFAEKNESRLYFIYLPEYKRYKNDYDNSNYILIKNTVNELNIPFIDIHEQLLKKEQNPLSLFPFELFGHYTEEGYKKIANEIYKSVQ